MRRAAARLVAARVAYISSAAKVGMVSVHLITYTVESTTSGCRVRHTSSASRSGGDKRGRYARHTLGARPIPTVLHGGRLRGA